MFDQKRSGWSFSWPGIILVVVFVLGVFWIFRQNPPGAADAAAENKIVWTEGTIVSGSIEVDAKSFLTFPINLNKRSSLDATFTTGDSAKRLAFSIISSADLEKWKAGEEVKFTTNTGPVPRGVIRRVMDPGYYVIIFDNRMNTEKMRIEESNITVE